MLPFVQPYHLFIFVTASTLVFTVLPAQGQGQPSKPKLSRGTERSLHERSELLAEEKRLRARLKRLSEQQRLLRRRYTAPTRLEEKRQALNGRLEQLAQEYEGRIHAEHGTSAVAGQYNNLLAELERQKRLLQSKIAQLSGSEQAQQEKLEQLTEENPDTWTPPQHAPDVVMASGISGNFWNHLVLKHERTCFADLLGGDTSAWGCMSRPSRARMWREMDEEPTHALVATLLDAQVLDPLEVALTHPIEGARLAAVDWLRRRGSSVGDWSVLALTSQDWHARWLAVLALGELRTPEALRVLLMCVEDVAPEVQRKALDTLIQFNGSMAYQGILKALRSGNIELRVYALENSTSLPRNQAANAMERALGDESALVRRRATTLLNGLGDP